jgi:hypothetical protein
MKSTTWGAGAMKRQPERMTRRPFGSVTGVE